MPYCSSEGKLHGFDDPTVEVNGEDVNGSTASAEVTISRPCASCGDDQISLYETTVEVDIDHECTLEALTAFQSSLTEEEVAELFKDLDEGNVEREFSVSSSGEGDCSERMQTTDRHGKPIKSYRYMRKLYDVSVTLDVECQHCGEEFEVEAREDGIAASSFETESSH